MKTLAQDIFVQALEREPAARAAFLAQACGDNAELHLEVQRLLVQAERAESYFGDDDGATLGAREFQETFAEKEGDMVGPYKLRQQIGEGGFGTVWMAEQSVPISRMVALKVIKAGMDTKQVLARFEAECQALAMMDHPHIAKVLDAGATATGRPWFAMELVRGIPITNYCDQAGLGTRERLGLFRDVCAAINHAHQKGVIHRDIKPSNVMVTLHGDQPVVKVIDFGIAKATQGRLTDQTLFTRFEQFDWIVMKAIEKDRSRRYETANGLSADIKRFLTSQPVEAAAPSVVYRLRKFIRRNRSAVAAGSVVAMSVLAGGIISVWQTVRATAANQSLRIERDAKETLANHNARLAEESNARGEKLSATLTRTRVALAERQWHYGNVGNARKLLDACPPHHRLWDWHTLRALCADTSLVFQSDVEFSRTGGVKVALSPDGLMVAYATRTSILVRKADGTDEGLRFEGPTGMIGDMAFSPDGKRIACVANHGFSGQVRIWDINDPATPRDIAGMKPGANRDAPSSGTGFHLRFSDDGRELMCAGSGMVHVWDAETKRLTTKFEHKSMDIREIMPTPDGTAFVAGCMIQPSAEDHLERMRRNQPATRPPARIVFLDRKTGAIVREILLEEAYLRGIAFSPDCRLAAIPAGKDDVQLWNLVDGTLADTLRGHQQSVGAIAFSADGRRLVTAGKDKTVRIWDVQARTEIRALTGHESAISGVACHAADGRIASVSNDGEVRIWSPLGAGERKTGESGHQGANEDGSRSCQFQFDGEYGINGILLWRTADPEGSKVALAVPSEAFPGRVLNFQLSPDGMIAAVSLANIDMEAPDELTTRIVLFEAATGKALHSLRTDLSDRPEIAKDPMARALARTMPYGAMRFSPDSSSISAACLAFAVAWDVSTGRMVMRVELPDKSEAAAFAWHPDPSTRGLVCGSSKGSVFALKLDSSDIVRKFQKPETQSSAGTINAAKSLTFRINDLSFSPKGDVLASASMDGRVMLWACADGSLVHEFTGHAGGVERVRFSKPRGMRLLTESEDGTARFWDTSSGDEIVSLDRKHLDDAILMRALEAAAVEAETRFPK